MDDVQVRVMLREWMESYLAQEHPMMPRPGSVCPFVKPALDADSIEIRRVTTASGDPQGLVLDAARRGLEEFALARGHEPVSVLRALVIAFPDLVEDGHVIDDVHEVIKGSAVEAGLMIGQFHADCTEPSARNRHFQVNRSPLPLLAIRRMTVHDILFLHQDPRWFRAYDRRFGHLYHGKRRIDSAFLTFYDGASREFGSSHCNGAEPAAQSSGEAVDGAAASR